MQKMRLDQKILLIGFLLVSVPSPLHAVELEAAPQTIFKAEVVAVGPTSKRVIPGTDAKGEVQEISVRFSEGPELGEVVRFENDYIQVEEGDTIFVNRFEDLDGSVIYGVRDVDRLSVVWGLVAAFVLFVLAFARWSGVRALISVVLSLFLISYVLLPLLVAGYSPVPVSFVVATLVLSVAIFGTHGFNKVSYAALLGTVLSVVCSGVLAWFVIEAARFTGFTGDASIYLNFNTQGTLDFRGLLLGATIIGMLGVLDDVAITQASLVEELKSAVPHATRSELYARAIKVGRHHVQALINTLFLAYTGAALPLLLLLQTTDDKLSYALNQEIVAVEVVRTIVGSVGLILAVPLSTWLAARLFSSEK